MRVVREFTRDPMRVSIFIWNEKYMVKVEYGPYEQWFKFPVEDLGIDRLVTMLDDIFFKETEKRFMQMHDSIRAASLRSAE